MTEQVMTAQDLAEAKFNFNAGWSPGRKEYARLLATVDALTGRAERAEQERDELRAWKRKEIADRDRSESEWIDAHSQVERERDTYAQQLSEALAAKERAEAERDKLGRQLDMTLQQKVYIERLGGLVQVERDEALALLAETRRALAELVALKDLKSREGKTADYLDRQPKAWAAAREALSTTAPEALRQQQEREAEMVAMIGALRGALEWAELEIDKRGYPGGWESQPVAKALSITPPQALREREERMAALERVADAARRLTVYTSGAVDGLGQLSTALAALDAVKGGL